MIPKSQNILKVIENFKKVLPMATRKDHLNMKEAFVTSAPGGCGTVHCHGGWYAVAVCDLKKGRVDFDHGAREMAKHLGFEKMGGVR